MKTKKNVYRIISIVLAVIMTIGTFVLSYTTLEYYLRSLMVVLTFMSLLISLFGILIVFYITKEDRKWYLIYYYPQCAYWAFLPLE